MSDISTCSQATCRRPSVFRYTWPGSGEAGCCLDCRTRIENIAEAMGFAISFEPLLTYPVELKQRSPEERELYYLAKILELQAENAELRRQLDNYAKRADPVGRKC